MFRDRGSIVQFIEGVLTGVMTLLEVFAAKDKRFM